MFQKPNLSGLVKFPPFLALQFVPVVPHHEVVQSVDPRFLACLLFNDQLRLFWLLAFVSASIEGLFRSWPTIFYIWITVAQMLLMVFIGQSETFDELSADF